jgi:hypothetical protein
MRDVLEYIAGLPAFSNVLLVCSQGHALSDVLERFLDRRINIIGPVATASSALLLAAQTRLDLAVIEPQLASGGSGPALAKRLLDDWGVATLIAAPTGRSASAWDA